MQRGFIQGQSPGDPLCRWRHASLILDVMPLDEVILGFSNRWYRKAMQSPIRVQVTTVTSISCIDAPHFIATKLEAFRSRGAGDYLLSSDLEDVVVVIDGRPSIDHELSCATPDVRSFVAAELKALLAERYFLEALPGYFAGEDQDGRRARSLTDRLRRIASHDAPGDM